MDTIFDIRDGELVRCTVNQADVVIPDGVTTIKYQAFRAEGAYGGQDKLETVVIPASVTKIESEAFYRCKNLRKVTILGPASLSSEVFRSCHSLKEVYLADGVKSIGSECFAYCEQLEELFIPQSVEHIGSDIACMEEAGHRHPSLLCARRGAGKNWHPNWNRIYHDIRFGDDRSHMFFHPTYFGMKRSPEETSAPLRERTQVTDMPHGTGEKKPEEKEPRTEPTRIPDIRLRLWVTATKKAFAGDEEYELYEEEREMLPRLIKNQEENDAAEHELDKPWEIVVTDDTGCLAPELHISACIAHAFPFDGETLTIAHDMPWRKNRYDELAISRLRKGETIIAEKHFNNGNFMDVFDVRLFIQWLDEPIRYWTLEEALAEIKAHQADWKALNDKDNVIAVHLAHSIKCAEHYKGYKPGEFPEQFIADLAQDKEVWQDLGAIIVQPCELYTTVHDYSDDYKCAAGISDDEDTSWTETHARDIAGRLSFEINMTDSSEKPVTHTPDFKEYLDKSDISGYMTELYKQAVKGDIGSLHILLYLAIMDSAVEDVMDYADMLIDAEDEFMIDTLWPLLDEAIKQTNEELGEECDDDDKYKKTLAYRFKMAYNQGDLMYEKSNPDYKSPTRLFGNKIIIMQRAYLNHVGLQEVPVYEPVAINDCVPKETKDYWCSLYRRSDCSSNQEAIYNDAIPYARQGDPYAMFIVGYLLHHGIRTAHDIPRVTILESDNEAAYPWLKAAADAGIKEACAETAAILFGRKDQDPEAEKLGLYYVAKGAEKDDKDSLEKLFDHFKDKDDAKAFEILVRLAKVYHSYKYDLMLAQWYEEGRGTTKDEKKAFEIVEYVYTHSSCTPYDSSHEDACEKLQHYLRNGIGCEVDFKRAGQISSEFSYEEDRMWELLTK